MIELSKVFPFVSSEESVGRKNDSLTSISRLLNEKNLEKISFHIFFEKKICLRE